MHRIAIALIAASSFVAEAGITKVEEFSSLQFEGFNDIQRGFVREPISIFDGMGEVLNAGGRGGWLHGTSRWSYRTRDWKGSASAYEGKKMLGNTSGAIEYRFNTNQKSFGGFFATIANKADASIKFFDGDTLVGSDVLAAAVGGEWSWNGWSSDVSFNRVSIDSQYRNRGGFLMNDAVRVSSEQVPTPGALAILATGFLVGTRRRR
jgi:hypothetical protein